MAANSLCSNEQHVSFDPGYPGVPSGPTLASPSHSTCRPVFACPATCLLQISRSIISSLLRPSFASAFVYMSYILLHHHSAFKEPCSNALVFSPSSSFQCCAVLEGQRDKFRIEFTTIAFRNDLITHKNSQYTITLRIYVFTSQFLCYALH